jgi:hypothetical protein
MIDYKKQLDILLKSPTTTFSEALLNPPPGYLNAQQPLPQKINDKIVIKPKHKTMSETTWSKQVTSSPLVFVVESAARELGQEALTPQLFLTEEILDLYLKMTTALKLNFTPILLPLKFDDEEECSLLELIALTKPTVIAPLGSRATQILLSTREKLSKIQGNFYPFELPNGLQTTICPLFHPEFLLINPSMKKMTWESLQKILKLI